MSDFLRDMDQNARVFITIALTAFLSALLRGWWDRFKARQALKPTPMRLRNGAYEEWGVVQRIQRWMTITTWIWALWIFAMLVLLAWHKLVHPII